MEDVLHFPAATGGEVAVQPMVFTRILDTVPASGWQVVQETDGLYVLLSGVRDSVEDETLAEALQQALAAQGAMLPPVKVRRVPSMLQTTAGKTPLIRSNMPRTLTQ